MYQFCGMTVDCHGVQCLVQAIMQGSYDEYVADRVHFLQSHCSIFRDLHPLSNVDCLSFVTEVEDAGDEEFILRQGSPARQVVILIEGSCKV